MCITICSSNEGTDKWLGKHLPNPIEYTGFGEVAIVYNTKVDFYEFWDELEALAAKPENQKFLQEEGGKVYYDRQLAREALAKYIFPRLVLDPVKPGDNLYNAEYEHKKEVFAHKFAKDFIMREGKVGKNKFSRNDIGKWF